MDEEIRQRILHLHTVEKLSVRQIAQQLHISRKTVTAIVKGEAAEKITYSKPSILDPYKSLIGQWYKDYPLLKSIQVYKRLKEYGYKGGHTVVSEYTIQYRKKKNEYYHALHFLPGEEAQVDWVVVHPVRSKPPRADDATSLTWRTSNGVKDSTLGTVYAFLMVLSYSRYVWGKFYPRCSFEFFLDGHIECFRKFSGLPHSCRYDNLKSVVLQRIPETKYNPQFLEFARHYGFGIYLCNTYSPHEKGRVERVGLDVRTFLYGKTFKDIKDLNEKFSIWLTEKNNTVHRSTNKKPDEMFKEERLIHLPVKEYSPARIIPAVLVSKTGFIQFETNKYSVPNTCAGKTADIVVYPEKIEIFAGNSRVALHKRIFLNNQMIENPLHREKLFEITPGYKYQRILQLMQNMDKAIETFLTHAEHNGEDKIAYAYELFKLLKLVPRDTLIWAVKKACSVSAYKLKSVISSLDLPKEKENNAVYPKDTNILNIKYEERRLEDYDRHE